MTSAKKNTRTATFLTGLPACVAASLVALTLSTPAGATGRAGGAVKVTAGKPSEFKFALSSRTARLGKIVFTITNRGKIVHDFKVCSTPRNTATANTCNGRGSRKLTPGQSVKLTVTFKKKGRYEYLCTVPGHAAAGMKGTLKVT